jgi:hypothetical protein
LLKYFVVKVIFELIFKNIKVLSKARGFVNRYKFSHEEIKKISKNKNLTKKK